MSESIKKVSESLTEQTYIIMPKDSNGCGRLFGGRLMEWMDLAAAITGRRHSGHEVTTASVNGLNFRAAAHIGDTIVIRARIIYTGRTSMEIRTDAYAEELNGERRMINSAYFTVIALDENEKPCRVPRIIPETEDERTEYNSADDRKRKRIK